MKKLSLVTLTEAIEFYKERTGVDIGKAFVLNKIYDGELSAVQTGSRLWLIKKMDILKIKKRKSGAPFGNKNNKYGRFGKNGPRRRSMKKIMASISL